MMVPKHITMAADAAPTMKSGRRYNFKFCLGDEVATFSAKVRELKPRCGERRISLNDVRMSPTA
jgi:hypothetical protein